MEKRNSVDQRRRAVGIFLAAHAASLARGARSCEPGGGVVGGGWGHIISSSAATPPAGNGASTSARAGRWLTRLARRWSKFRPRAANGENRGGPPGLAAGTREVPYPARCRAGEDRAQAQGKRNPRLEPRGHRRSRGQRPAVAATAKRRNDGGRRRPRSFEPRRANPPRSGVRVNMTSTAKPIDPRGCQAHAARAELAPATRAVVVHEIDTVHSTVRADGLAPSARRRGSPRVLRLSGAGGPPGNGGGTGEVPARRAGRVARARSRSAGGGHDHGDGRHRRRGDGRSPGDPPGRDRTLGGAQFRCPRPAARHCLDLG